MTAFPRVGDTFGRYLIRSQLGQGGMGVVFRATQVDLGRDVALKVIPLHHLDDPDFRRRFQSEAHTLATLDSPHITQVHDFGQVDDCLYIAAQLVAGGDVAHVLRDTGPLSPAAALDVATQVAYGLQDAHDVGVLHRDVKPSNVLLRRGRQRAHAYLCDFGVARRSDSELTQTGVVLGTYAYLAPECFAGGSASVASDVYAVGCLLVAMLTGRAPYSGTDVQVAHQHQTSPVPQWSGRGDVDETRVVNRVLRRALAKDPADRHPSAEALAADLERAGRVVGDVGAVTVVDRTAHSDATPDPAPHADQDAEVDAASATTASSALPPGGTQLARPSPTRVARTEPTRRPRRLVAVAGAAAALLVVVVGAVSALGSGSTPQVGSAPLPPDEVATSPAPREATGSDDTGAVAEPDPVTSTAAPSVPKPCWDGADPVDGSCTMPTGRRGLRWVYPAIAEQRCAPDPGIRSDKVAALACVVRLPSGSVTLTYSEYVDWDRLLDRYTAVNQGRTPVTSDGQLVYPTIRRPESETGFRASQHYPEPIPFAVTATGDVPRAVSTALARVQPRPAQAFRLD